MKNKIIIIFLLLLLFCSLCALNSSYAVKTGAVYIESSSEVIEKDEEVDITINLEDAKTAAFNFSLYFDETKFEVISFPENTNVVGNEILFVWFDVTGGKNPMDGELVSFKFKSKQEGLATFVLDGEFYSEEGQLIQTEFKEKQLQIGKERSLLQQEAENEQGRNSQVENANLQVLRVDKEGIVPTFDKGVYEYYLTVDNSTKEIDVLAISENPSASINISGNADLKEGLNTINIEVTSEDKSQQKVYTIQVTKTANLELANTNLEILAIENYLLNPPFDVNETNYKTEISNEIESINVLAVPENEQAKVEVVGNADLKVGNNLVTVTVTAPNGFSKKRYLIEVHRRDEEEEKVFLEEQKSQIDKTEEAYKLEETSANYDKDEDSVKKDDNKNVVLGAIIIVIAFMIVSIIILKYKNYIVTK